MTCDIHVRNSLSLAWPRARTGSRLTGLAGLTKRIPRRIRDTCSQMSRKLAGDGRAGQLRSEPKKRGEKTVALPLPPRFFRNPLRDERNFKTWGGEGAINPTRRFVKRVNYCEIINEERICV